MYVLKRHNPHCQHIFKHLLVLDPAIRSESPHTDSLPLPCAPTRDGAAGGMCLSQVYNLGKWTGHSEISSLLKFRQCSEQPKLMKRMDLFLFTGVNAPPNVVVWLAEMLKAIGQNSLQVWIREELWISIECGSLPLHVTFILMRLLYYVSAKCKALCRH